MVKSNQRVDVTLFKPVSTALLLACLASAAPAFAQRPDAPFTGNAVPQGSPLPRILPSTPPAVLPETGLLRPTAPAATPAVNVPIRSVAIAGATAFSPVELQPLTGNLVGSAVPVARIEQARAAILSLYRTNGFVLTTVSAVVGAQGDLRFNVVEGRIAAVKLDGDIGPAGVQVLRFLNHLTETTPIDNATIERWLLLAQDIPGITINAVLQPSLGDPGALTLVAQVRRQRFNGLLTADNRTFRQTGPIESLLVLDANSFTEFGERTEVSLFHTDANTQNFGQASTEFYVGGSGLKLRFSGGYGQAVPSDFLRTIGYRGNTTVFGIGAVYPLLRSRAQTINVVGSFNGVDTETRTDSGPNGQSRRASNDDLRIVRLGLEYAVQDELAGEGRPAVNFAGLRGSQGLNILGSSGNHNPVPGRLNERVDFIKATAELTRTQTLFSPWTDASVALRASLQGQISNSVLPPAEKFFLGGSEINRGFYSGQVTGDNALAWSFELQLNTSFDLSLFQTPIPVGAQFYTFYDRGQTFENQSIDPNARLSSMGIGGRFTITRFTEFDIEGVIRNTRLPVGTAGIVQPLKADAAYWRVLCRF